jgi:tryptophanyl-tRNA synthetase
MGYGEAKQVLFEAAMSYFASARAKREQLAANPSYVKDILQSGAQKARAKGKLVLERVREACGLGRRRV